MRVSRQHNRCTQVDRRGNLWPYQKGKMNFFPSMCGSQDGTVCLKQAMLPGFSGLLLAINKRDNVTSLDWASEHHINIKLLFSRSGDDQILCIKIYSQWWNAFLIIPTRCSRINLVVDACGFWNLSTFSHSCNAVLVECGWWRNASHSNSKIISVFILPLIGFLRPASFTYNISFGLLSVILLH